MKYVKRILSFAIALAMMMSFVPASAFTAQAVEDSYPQLQLGQTAYLTTDTNGGEGIFRFVPEEDGYYRFYSFDNELDPYGYILNQDMEELDHDDDGASDNNFKIDYEMTAGEVYYLRSKPYFADAQGYYSVSVIKLVPATSMQIVYDDVVRYVGVEYWLDVEFGPENGIAEDVTWTSGDPQIANVSSDGFLLFAAAGTTTVTATSDSGFTDTITVTAQEMPVITLGEEKVLNIAQKNEEFVFKFIPEEDGAYRFYSFDNTVDTWAYVMDKYWGTVVYSDANSKDGSFRAECMMTAGEVYYLQTSCNQDEPTTYSVSVMKVVEATSMEILEENITGYFDTYQSLSVEFAPDNGMAESITWTSADPKIATVDEHGNVYLVSEGVTTVTATSEKGKTDSVTVTVKGPDEITLGQVAELTTQYNGGVGIFRFVPEEDGYYRFYSFDNSVDTYGYIMDENLQELGYDDDGGEGNNFQLEWKMTAGQTYHFRTRPYGSESVGTYKVSIEKMTQATSMQIHFGETTGYVGERLYMEAVFEPQDSIKEVVTWTSSDPNVATVDEYGAVKLLAEGSATITATSENGLTDSVTVTAKPVRAIELDKPIILSADVDGGLGVFRFVPEVDGQYRFYSYDNDFDTYGYLLDENMDELSRDDDSGGNGNFLIEYTLTAGQTYYLQARPYSERDSGIYTVILLQLVDAAAIEIENGDISAYVRERWQLTAKFAPKNAIFETVTWSSSDPEVAEVDAEGYVQMHKVGKATITVTSANGLTDSITVTVVDYPELQLGVPEQVVIDEETPDAWYSFTPEKDGYYAFYSISQIDTFGTLLDGEGNYLAENDDMGGDLDFKIKHRMKAGESYILHVRGYGSNTGSAQIIVEETKYITDLQLISLPGKLEYVEDYLNNLSMKGLRLRATWSDGATSDFVCLRDDMYIEYIEDERIDVDTSEMSENHKITIVCGGQSVSFSIQVVESPVERLELVTGTKHTYVEGYDTYDGGIYYTHEHTDAVVRIVYKDGTSKLAHVGDNVDGYYVQWTHNQHETPWIVGTNNASEISYLGQTINMPITVKENTVASVEVVSGSLTLIENSYGEQKDGFFYYYYGTPEDTRIKITYTDGTSKTVEPGKAVDGYPFSYSDDQYYNPWEVGKENYLPISYLGVEGKIPVQILPSPVERIELNSAPTREYIYGDTQYGNYFSGEYDFHPTDITGLSFTVYYTDGTNKTYTAKDAKQNEYGEIRFDGYPFEFMYELWNVKPGEHLVPARYMGASFSYGVTLRESNVESIEVTKQPTNAIYSAYGWPEYIGMEVLITYTDGTTKTVKVTEQNSGYEFNMSMGTAVYAVNVDGHQLLMADKQMVYLGAFGDIPGIKTEDTRWAVSIEPQKVTPNGDGMVIKVNYNDGTTETLTLTDVVYSEFDKGYINGLGKTSRGMLRYFVRTWFDDDGKPVRYMVEFMENEAYLDAPEYLVGDMNEDGQITDADAMYLLRHTLFASRYPLNQSGDVNKDDQVTDADAMYLLRHTLFPSRYPL